MPTPPKLVYRVCAQCSQVFGIPRPSRLKAHEGIFCSRKCYHANRAGRITSPEIRFWKHVDKTADCWLWTGAQCKGYGQLSSPKRSRYAHRLSWEISNGDIPEGLQVLHRCDTPLCVRPDHLFLGTNTDNIEDRIKKQRYVRLITAFDETKAMVEWLKDARCSGTRSSIELKLKRGFSPEYALTSRPLTRFEVVLCASISRSLRKDFLKFSIDCCKPSC
jgi:hypothetical protein